MCLWVFLCVWFGVFGLFVCLLCFCFCFFFKSMSTREQHNPVLLEGLRIQIVRHCFLLLRDGESSFRFSDIFVLRKAFTSV